MLGHVHKLFAANKTRAVCERPVLVSMQRQELDPTSAAAAATAKFLGNLYGGAAPHRNAFAAYNPRMADRRSTTLLKHSDKVGRKDTGHKVAGRRLVSFGAAGQYKINFYSEAGTEVTPPSPPPLLPLLSSFSVSGGCALAYQAELSAHRQVHVRLPQGLAMDCATKILETPNKHAHGGENNLVFITEFDESPDEMPLGQPTTVPPAPECLKAVFTDFGAQFSLDQCKGESYRRYRIAYKDEVIRKKAVGHLWGPKGARIMTNAAARSIVDDCIAESNWAPVVGWAKRAFVAMGELLVGGAPVPPRSHTIAVHSCTVTVAHTLNAGCVCVCELLSIYIYIYIYIYI
jgi:hypothetical protein